jgi:hypothetical protein
MFVLSRFIDFNKSLLDGFVRYAFKLDSESFEVSFGIDKRLDILVT